MIPTFACGLFLLAGPADEALDRAVGAALRAWHVPGAAVVIVKDDRVIHLKGHGVREVDGDAVTPDTVFPLASCSKAFTTAALARLVDDHKVGWDDPVRKHLPWFHLADALADRDVTLRDLVTHRTGLAPHELLWYRAPWAPEEAVRRTSRLPLDRPFRSSFQYQSPMFTAAGLAAGAANGTTWADLVRTKLLDPIGMKATTLTTPASGRATGHQVTAGGKAVAMPWYVQEEPNPAGSVHSTARDLGQWLRFQLGEGTLDGRSIVRAGSLRETHTPQVALRLEGPPRDLNPETTLMSYGMGWLVQDYRGRLMISHAGAIDGFRVQVTFLPREKLGIAVLANVHETRLNLALTNTLVDLMLGLEPRDWNGTIATAVRKEQASRPKPVQPTPGTKPTRPLAEYAGSYEHPAYGTARVTVEAGGLVLRWGRFRCPLTHFEKDIFQIRDDVIGMPTAAFDVSTDGIKAVKLAAPFGVTFSRP